MYIPFLLYLGSGLGILTALSLMLVHLGSFANQGSQACNTSQAAAATIATGFAVIGLGAVLIVGAVLMTVTDERIIAVPLAIGFAAICLGLGFSHAAATLRLVTTAPSEPKIQTE